MTRFSEAPVQGYIAGTAAALKAKERILEIMNRADLTEKQKQNIIRRMRDGLEEGKGYLETSISSAKQEMSMLQEADAWAQSKHSLQKAESSKLHILIEASKSGKVWFSKDIKNSTYPIANFNLPAAQTFVIQHDWAAAFNNSAETTDGEIMFPANPAVFEMKINGRHRIDLIFGGLPEIVSFVETSKGWVALARLPFNPLTNDDIAIQQIRAVCIALEAEIADTEIVRAPHKLNRQREKRGKLPIKDYHIVNLARRSRALPSDIVSGEKRRGPRLHFRRGHWRHFEESKTWINWTLVGNPDLGYIDKEYRL